MGASYLPNQQAGGGTRPTLDQMTNRVRYPTSPGPYGSSGKIFTDADRIHNLAGRPGDPLQQTGGVYNQATGMMDLRNRGMQGDNWYAVAPNPNGSQNQVAYNRPQTPGQAPLGAQGPMAAPMSAPMLQPGQYQYGAGAYDAPPRVMPMQPMQGPVAAPPPMPQSTSWMPSRGAPGVIHADPTNSIGGLLAGGNNAQYLIQNALQGGGASIQDIIARVAANQRMMQPALHAPAGAVGYR